MSDRSKRQRAPLDQAIWQDRREPILRALEARVEPLETMLRRVLEGMAEAHAELMDRVEEISDRLQSAVHEAAGWAVGEVRRAEEQSEDTMASLHAQQRSAAADLETVRPAIEGLSEQFTAAAREFQARLTGAERRLAAQLDNARKTLATHVESSRKVTSDTFGHQSGALAQTIQADVSTAAERVREEVRGAAENLQADLGATRDRLEEAPTREDLAALRTSVRESADKADAVAHTAVQGVEALMTRTEQALDAMEVRSKELVDRITVSAATIDAGFARVDRLSSIIESLGRRRGFQDLIASERDLREEQAGFIRDLVSASERVSERAETLGALMEDLERRLEAATGAAGALQRLPDDVSGTLSSHVERLRERVENSLDERFAQDVQSSITRLRAELDQGVPLSETLKELRALAHTQQELARAQERAEQAAGQLGEELSGLQKRIDGWGRPGSSPRLAQELQRLEGRVGELESQLSDGLPEEVARRVAAEVMEALRSKRRGIWRP